MPPKRVYINPHLHEQIAKLYKSREDGLNRVVATYLQLRELALTEIRGIFTPNELTGIVDAFNGTLVTTPTVIPPAQMIRYELADAETLQDQSLRFGYNAAHMQRKLESLSETQAFFLIDECLRFWNEPAAYGAPTPDLEKFLAFNTQS